MIRQKNVTSRKTNVLTKVHEDLQTAPPPGIHISTKPNVLTKFHDDKAQNVTSKKTNVLTKFHEDWAQNVSSRMFTCFHYIHIEKNDPPPCGHVFPPIMAIFKLVRDIYKINVETKFYDN
ncbi:hypothetical protein DPMN_067728 [Dreissena polymorpha]|uniref:Uncharacterized protein n=1 Tax=Dreissena polymorpha TaxID=45954 RepID=A0A9D3YZQ7_DREPO|nr:hypothetical protein DPMN_067728 [Dreissena polymorpha]